MRVKKTQVWGLISPTLILMILIGVIPVIYVIYLSVFKYSVFSKTGMVYVGFDNFRKLVFDASFLKSLSLGLTFVAICCLVEIPLGLLIANVLTYEFKGKGVFRTIMALPLAMAPVSIGSMWVYSLILMSVHFLFLGKSGLTIISG